MTKDPCQEFHVSASLRRKSQAEKVVQAEGCFGLALTPIFIGISAVLDGYRTYLVSLAIRDATYLIDFTIQTVTAPEGNNGHDYLAEYIIKSIRGYEHRTFTKAVGAGLPSSLRTTSPSLCSRLWLELDIVPIVIQQPHEHTERIALWLSKRVDEQADSMARKCIMNFGPSLAPLLQVAWRGIVEVDASFQAPLISLDDYKTTCSFASWETVMHYAKTLRKHKTKIAFFSSTPQGGGVALMRHALVRFSRVMGVDLRWYVPKPHPGVFRVTKNIHNTLQGVSPEGQFITEEEKGSILEWITDNGNRYWFSEGGPLCRPEKGGADIVIIDDPQMPCLIPLIKKLTPSRPVFYRSHIQIRTDLIKDPNSPQADVWNFLWQNIKHADLFISHPMPSFVPHNVPREKVLYMPATTDWLDGLNKPMEIWDTGYYGHLYNIKCRSERMTELQWPRRKYIIQVSRFDPAKGLPTVVDAYACFREQLEKHGGINIPQLVICGNASVDDPDGTTIYDQVMTQLETKYPHLLADVSVMRLDPCDQLLNCLMANAHVVLQLSTYEGFEVKVSEALHAGRPVIASFAGGIPLQVKDKINGFLVQPGDWRAVAGHLMELFTDVKLHERMAQAAKTGVSDEVGTVGNALSWYYLTSKWAQKGPKLELLGNEQWVNDMARNEAGQPYTEGENRLPRSFTQL
ncbi:UDP-Glycosyltransferase/glycogen phosphorylase [Trichoderma aethiopicum]